MEEMDVGEGNLGLAGKDCYSGIESVSQFKVYFQNSTVNREK